MLASTSKLTKNDMAKYPFLKVSAKYVRMSDLKVEDLANPELKEILARAEERVEEAILYVRVSRKLRREDVEISSYPVAIVLAAATGSSFIKRRYALAEAKQVCKDLEEESKEKIYYIAKNFQWNPLYNKDSAIPFEFMISFTEYLRNITHLKGKKWKLVNRLLSDGNVYITRNETARLLSEEVRKHIEERLMATKLPRFPSNVMEIAERIKELCTEKIDKAEMEGFPREVVSSAFPPCIENLYQSVSSGRHISHVSRFTLTSFLINVGMPTENVIQFFKNFSDYNERMTRYQIEHIAGERGSRTRYVPPKCDTLKTHGVCRYTDQLCQKINHPLAYYKMRSRQPTPDRTMPQSLNSK